MAVHGFLFEQPFPLEQEHRFRVAFTERLHDLQGTDKGTVEGTPVDAVMLRRQRRDRPLPREFAGRQVQGLGEPFQVVVGHGQPHGHGVAAELLHVGGAALQHLEQVDARHGPPGAFQPHNPLFLFLDGEQDGRPAEAVHHP